jgi:hypothetical protein
LKIFTKLRHLVGAWPSATFFEDLDVVFCVDLFYGKLSSPPLSFLSLSLSLPPGLADIEITNLAFGCNMAEDNNVTRTDIYISDKKN